MVHRQERWNVVKTSALADVTNVLADDQCTSTKPDASQKCNRKDCEPDWVPNDRSVVSYFL